MGTIPFLSAGIFIGDLDITGDSNQVSQAATSEDLENTTFGSLGVRSRIQGQQDWTISGDGFVQYGVGSIDEAMFEAVVDGEAGVPMAVVPVMGAAAPVDGDLIYFGSALRSNYSPGGDVGELLTYSFSASGDNGQRGLTRGNVLLYATALGATADGTAVQLGDVAAGERIRAAVHVLAVSGGSPTADWVLESDDNEGFASATTRATFAQQTATGTAWVESTTVTTDDWWRITSTIGGSTPSFTVLLEAGIGTD